MVRRGKSKRRDLRFQGIIMKSATEDGGSTMEKKNWGGMEYRWQKRVEGEINQKVY